MKAIVRVTTLAVGLLTVSLRPAAAQQPTAAFVEQMRNGDQAVARHQYGEALQADKKAYSLSNKSSFEAAIAIAVAYRGLGAHKNELLDTSNSILRQFGVTGFPTFIIIDGDGIIRARSMGWGPEIESRLERELKNSVKKGG
ncbi:MAG TPA: hypothetical protein VFZ98_02725 [Vicinamibacterales bacterium]